MKKKLTKILTGLFAVVATVALSVSLVACGNKDEYKFGKEIVAVGSQMDIFSALENGSADVGVMDSVMAGYYMANRYADKYETLGYCLSEEEYGIGAKKGNDALMSKINEGLIEVSKSGKMAEIANIFGLNSEVLVNSDTVNPKQNATDNSWDEVVESGKIIIGYTVFAPIAYTENNSFTGYDIELAQAVVDYLNTAYSCEVRCEFIEIEWNSKETLLENGSIDLVWNGMTITDERIEGMSMSIPYLSNKQAIVIKKADKDKYNLSSLEEFMASASDVIVAVESGSAAEEIMVIKKD